MSTLLKKLKNILSFRRYIAFFAIFVGAFIFYHAVIWTFFTSKLLDIEPPHHIGDLSRIGYQVSSIHPRVTAVTLPKKHIEFSAWKGEPIDIITIGDSFSNGGAGGTNSYYQDYIATRYGYRVMNINPSLFGENSIEAISALQQSGLIDEIKPKAILIESVGRYVISRFAKPMNWEQNITREAIYKDLNAGQWGDGKPHKEKQYFITTANYKLPLYNFYYLFSPNALNYSDVYKLPLSKPFFNVKHSSTLLAYQDDIGSIAGVTPDKVATVNDNFNHLSDLLKEKNIHLFFMISVDKYDLYHDYILNNPYDANPLFDLLRPSKKRYTFIDTKAILSAEIQKGQKDIFFADDTHWSNLASESVVRQTHFPEEIAKKSIQVR